MGETIGAIVWHLFMLAGFVYLLLVMNGKLTPPIPLPLIQKPGIGVKILVYAGVALFALSLILDLI